MTKSSFLPVSFKHHRITIQEPLPDFLNICELVFYFCLIESLEEAKGHQAVNFKLQYLLILSSYQIIKKKLPGESLSNLEFHLHVSEQQSFHSWAHSHMAGKSHPSPPKKKNQNKTKSEKLFHKGRLPPYSKILFDLSRISYYKVLVWVCVYGHIHTNRKTMMWNLSNARQSHSSSFTRLGLG